jgi:hypothetical protein
MPPEIFLFILCAAGAVIGALRSYRMISASRKTSPHSQALLEWSEKPFSSLKYEPYAAVAILIHTLAVSAFVLLALIASNNPSLQDNPLFANDLTMTLLDWFIQCGCMAVIGYQFGSVLVAFPMIIFRRERVSIALTEEGMIHGQNLLPWRWFSHFSIDSHRGILRLFSVFAPDLPSLISNPPAPIALMELSDRIQGFLPLQPSEEKRSWYRSKIFLVPAIALVCILLAMAGWLALRLQRELSLFVNTLLMSILIFAGGVIMNLFAFGVLTTRSNPHKRP